MDRTSSRQSSRRESRIGSVPVVAWPRLMRLSALSRNGAVFTSLGLSPICVRRPIVRTLVQAVGLPETLVVTAKPAGDLPHPATLTAISTENVW